MTQDYNATCAQGPLEIGMTLWWHLDAPGMEVTTSTLPSHPDSLGSYQLA